MKMILLVFLVALFGGCPDTECNNVGANLCSWSKWLAPGAGGASGMTLFEGREWTEMGLAVVGIGVMILGFIRFRK
jgi:hypothetical protein